MCRSIAKVIIISRRAQPWTSVSRGFVGRHRRRRPISGGGLPGPHEVGAIVCILQHHHAAAAVQFRRVRLQAPEHVIRLLPAGSVIAQGFTVTRVRFVSYKSTFGSTRVCGNWFARPRTRNKHAKNTNDKLHTHFGKVFSPRRPVLLFALGWIWLPRAVSRLFRFFILKLALKSKVFCFIAVFQRFSSCTAALFANFVSFFLQQRLTAQKLLQMCRALAGKFKINCMEN